MGRVYCSPIKATSMRPTVLSLATTFFLACLAALELEGIVLMD